MAVTAVFANRRHHAELVQAAREMRTPDVLLAEETGRSPQGVRLVPDNVADTIAADGVRTADELAARESTCAVHDALGARVAGVPQLDAVTLDGADGKLVNFSCA